MPKFYRGMQDIDSVFNLTADKSGSLSAPLYPAGPDGDAGIAQLAENTISLIASGVESARGYRTANAVNFIGFVSAATGDPPQIGALGADGNIDLYLKPRGTGYVQFGTTHALGGAALAGYIEIKDEAGNVRKLGVVA